MNVADLTIGRTYYRVTYADPDMTMPAIQPMIYLGLRVPGDEIPDEQRKLYFQDTISFVISGAATAVGFDGDAQVFSALPNELGSSFVTLEQLISEVQATFSRARSLGHPVLKKAPGKWGR